jgi:methyl-accepting chemotaxis protein
MKLGRKIFISNLFLFLLFSILFISLFLFYTHSFFSQKTNASLESLASAQAKHIETYFDQLSERLDLVTSRNLLRQTIQSYNEEPTQEKVSTIEDIILSAKDSIKDYERIWVVGLDGKIIASTDDDFIGRDVSQQPFFSQALEENNFFLLKENDEVHILVSGPFIYQDEVIGVGVTAVNLDTLLTILSSYDRFGEAGESYLNFYSGTGDPYIVTPRGFVAKGSSDQVPEIIRNLLFEEEVTGYYIDDRGEKVIAVTRKIAEYPLGLVLKVNFFETFLPIYKMFIFSLLIIVFSVFAFMHLSRYLSKKITEPIKILIEAIQRDEKERFIWKEDEKFYDEVEELADAFEKLSKRVIRSRDILEKEVQDRTKELQEASSYFVGREEKMVELKKENEQLKQQLET